MRNRQRWRCCTAVALLALAAYLSAWLGLSERFPGLGGFLFPAFFFLWLAIAGSGPFSGGRLALVALMSSIVALDADKNLLPLVVPLERGCQAVNFAQESPRQLDCAGLTPVQVYRQFGEDPRKPRYTLIHTATSVGQYLMPLKVLPVNIWQDHLALRASASWQSLVLAPYTSAGGWLKLDALASQQWAPVWVYGQADAISGHNYNVYLWELARVLRRSGLSEFVLMPQTQDTRRPTVLELVRDEP